MWEWARSLGLFEGPDEDIQNLELLWRATLRNGVRVFDQDQGPNLGLVAFTRDLYRPGENNVRPWVSIV